MASVPKENGKLHIRWALVGYDILVFLFVFCYMMAMYGNRTVAEDMLGHLVPYTLSLACVLVSRICFGVYGMILRYGGVQCYLRLFVSDLIAILGIQILALLPFSNINWQRAIVVIAFNLLGALFIRLMYRYAYRHGTELSDKGKLLRKLMVIFAGKGIINERAEKVKKIRVAIVGAGRLGAVLADELLSNDNAAYYPACFVDMDSEKWGRKIMGIPVVPEGEIGLGYLKDYGVQELIFAITYLTNEKRDFLYKYYRTQGYRIKTYDYPMQDVNKSGKRSLREFDIEELLFRQPITINNELTKAYYEGKTVLITGGGGSIGSELCRQLAKMAPKQIIILDIYENGVYDVQQELRIAYKGKLNLQVEICSITNKVALERVFEAYHPNIVINAAAHKHVPLMEHNVIEAVENNVFGSLNVVECCEKYGVERMMTVSTDKAVNPTNVMGATKRMCELIELAHSQSGTKTTFSATRFGNVLGSAGSVIPLFKRQITNGGPITLTDKRIIRYFMTIPEASQLVLQSGAMAKNGELFVLDMGQPVKILDLAENMIRLSGFEPYKDIDIIETGLRPGEKLYEELLVKSETLTKTENELIFIEKDEPISMECLNERLAWLEEAVKANDDELMKKALHRAVPTFKTPEEVNAEAIKAAEMQNVKVVETL